MRSGRGVWIILAGNVDLWDLRVSSMIHRRELGIFPNLRSSCWGLACSFARRCRSRVLRVVEGVVVVVLLLILLFVAPRSVQGGLCMSFAMAKENVTSREMFLACRAFIRSFTCVRPLVSLDVLQLGEGPVAHAALLQRHGGEGSRSQRKTSPMCFGRCRRVVDCR